MSIEVISVILFGGMLMLLALGVPVAFALGGLSLIFTLFFDGPAALYTVATTTYQQITSLGLMAIPLFLVMGNFLVHSGISERLFHALGYWLTGVRGGLAVVCVAVCVALAMCGGFGPGILTMGLVAVPAMLKQNYHKSLALGSVMAGGVLGIIIPPSLIMIIFGFISVKITSMSLVSPDSLAWIDFLFNFRSIFAYFARCMPHAEKYPIKKVLSISTNIPV